MTIIANVSLNDVTSESESAQQSGLSAQSNDVKPTTEITNSSTALETFSANLKDEMFSWSAWKWAEPFRTRLGMADIGNACVRAIWYGYRHATPQMPSGMKTRLFQRGKREESFVTETLRGIGFTVYDPFPVGAFNDHYGGKCDGVVIAPERYGFGQTPFLLSIKTSATGGAFTKYDKPMAEANQRYWTQECAYGLEMGIEYAIWIIANKNDDDLQIQMHALNRNHAEAMKERAHRVIFVREMPVKISKSSKSRECKYCPHLPVCHDDAPMAVNCRTCEFSEPHANLKDDTGRPGWFCSKNNAIIPNDVTKTGCNLYMQISQRD